MPTFPPGPPDRDAARVTRRTALGLMTIGAGAFLSACASGHPGAGPTATRTPTPTPTSTPTPTPTPTPTAPVIARVPAPVSPFTGLPGAGNLLAWTVDDGADASVVAAYAAFAASTGTRLTLFMTGSYPSWAQNAAALRPLVESGQVQIGNHTWTHPDLTSLSDQGIVAELQRNHDAITQLFGVDARPFFRPPYGFYNKRMLAAAASIGYTAATMWYGSLADSSLLTPDQIVANANQWFLPQHIVIGHLNHPPVTQVFPQLEQIIASRNLQTVTLNDVFSSQYHP